MFQDFSAVMMALCNGRVPKILAVAVSGGSDSMCLLRLAERFAQQHNSKVMALIVDHGVRQESCKEAQQVAQWLFPLETHILTWTAPRKTHALMRKARYHLLCAACHKLGASMLLLGHHLDDQLETVLMREGKNSHWRGLAGMSYKEERHGITLVRPLLSFRKEALRDMLADHPYIEDPSNRDPNALRTKMRLFFAQEPDQQAWIQRTQRYGCQRQEEATAMRLFKGAVLHTQGYITLDAQQALSLPLERAGWHLWHWISSIAYQNMPLRPQLLNTLWQESMQALAFPRRTRHIGTLGGVLFSIAQGKLCLFREWGRLKAPRASFCGFWDGRFLREDIVSARQITGGKDFFEKHAYASYPMGQDSIFIPCASPVPLFTALCFEKREAETGIEPTYKDLQSSA